MASPSGTFDNGEKYIVVIVLLSISCSLSLVGSSCIIRISFKEILKSNDRQHRLLFALSCADFVNSMSCLLMPYLIPSFMGLPGAVGNHATCTTSGFFFVVASTSACCYNSFLSIYFFLVVCRNWKDRDFSKMLQVLVHYVAIVLPVAIGLVGAVTKTINPIPVLNFQCLFSAFPWHCEKNDCERSSVEVAKALFQSVNTVSATFSIVGFVCTFLVWNTVRRTIQRSSSYRFGNDRDTANEERLKQVSIQAVLYSLVYLNSMMWPILAVTMRSLPGTVEERNGDIYVYVLQLLYATLYPLKGVFNFIVYTRQKVQQWRKAAPRSSILWIYWQIILTTEIPRPQRIPATLPLTATTGTVETTGFGHSQQSAAAEEVEVSFDEFGEE
ncbi:expressed unknown protein [Seminavis robusta]|uniref:G-protein coupled receptors family 1 profile domain-containing protein n=1 Tax=Seminavis robusta TaxID=568900 RepID=A0A9N8HA92_9STRA|nr:expressed unknown protein [Seminavis robusta]|eukprot:Sro234_g094310.1 n/a (385) ;mRNA; r:6868-8090